MRFLSMRSKVIAGLVVALTVFLVVFMGYQTLKLAGFFLEEDPSSQGPDDETDGDEDPDGEDGGEKDYLFPDNKLELLLLGVDSRGGVQGSRSDTTMVAFLDLTEATAKILSIPRDTRVQIPGYALEKFTHAHSYGGPDLVMETANDFLGTDIQHYVEVDFSGFKQVVDAVGGVELEVPVRMKLLSEGIDLYPGVQTLDGSEALQFVRYRSDGGDLVRIERQQLLIKTLAKKVLETRNIWTVTKLVNAGLKMTETDLTLRELTNITTSMLDINVDDIELATLPGESKLVDELWYIIADREKALDLVDIFQGESSID